MWLINTHTFKQEDIVNPEKGSYAILSHTWGDRELSFKQYKDIRNARKTKRLTKVLKTIRMAYDQKLKYAWVDTCCIDKSSSAELSEAINSMFKWYSDAAVCFAYLPDLPSVTQISMSSPEADEEEIQQKQATFFSRCRWFSRGWTLQELVAPNIVEFYDSEWNLYGTKATLAREISNITRIPHIALYGSFSPQKFSVAQRMSWAANRCTTRVEDIAYCLMGLFDINMALLYGEGNKAFARLQEEICKQSADLSLFAWKSEDEISTSSPSQKYRGIFASSPSEFRDSSAIYLISRKYYDGEFRITNRGLCLDQGGLCKWEGRLNLALDCSDRNADLTNSTVGIILRRTPHGYVRSSPHKFSYLPLNHPTGENVTPIYIAKVINPDDSAMIDKRSITVAVEGEDQRNLFFSPEAYYDPIEQLILLGNGESRCKILVNAVSPSRSDCVERFVIVLDSYYVYPYPTVLAPTEVEYCVQYFGTFTKGDNLGNWDQRKIEGFTQSHLPTVYSKVGSFNIRQSSTGFMMDKVDGDDYGAVVNVSGEKTACSVKMDLRPETPGIGARLHIVFRSV